MTEAKPLSGEELEAIRGRASRMSCCEIAHNLPDALEVVGRIGLPAIVRPAFTLGGEGGGTAADRAQFVRIVEAALWASPISEVLIKNAHARTDIPALLAAISALTERVAELTERLSAQTEAAVELMTEKDVRIAELEAALAEKEGALDAAWEASAGDDR